MTRLKKLDLVFATPKWVIIFMALCLLQIAIASTTIAVAFHANATSNSTALALAHQAQAQTEYTNKGICQLVVPIGQLGQIPIASSPTGEALSKQLEAIKAGANGSGIYFSCAALQPPGPPAGEPSP